VQNQQIRTLRVRPKIEGFERIMPLDRMSRNDFILLAVFVTVVFGLVLIAFAPVANEATLTMRLWAIADSPISIAVVSTFIAAFAGTWGAQLLAERMANRRALLTEIRATNAALGLIYNITNTYIVTKNQFILDLNFRQVVVSVRLVGLISALLRNCHLEFGDNFRV
jgi:hypothetical protein